MQTLKLSLFILIVFSNCNKLFAQIDSNFTISGKVNGLLNNKMIWLQNAEGEQFKIDSTMIIDGVFNFSGNIPRSTLYRLKLGNSTRESFPFFLESANIRMECDYKSPFKCTMKGSYNQHLVEEFEFRESLAWNNEVAENLRKTYKNYNEKAGYIRKEKFSNALKEFVQLHPNDKAIAYLTSLNSDYILDDELSTIYNKFGEQLKKGEFAKDIKSEIELRNASKIGKPVKSFGLYDINSDKVNLYTLQGKYVLLYYWVADYEPCKQMNTELLKLYKKYKDSDFEVMAISLDTLAEKWQNAIQMDNLNWINVADKMGWDNDGAKALAVKSVPYTVLLDRQGEVLARDLRPQEYDNILNLIVAAQEAQKAENEKGKRPNIFAKLLPKPKKKKVNSGALGGAKN